jgi:glutamate-5-semialdehyde dehydrogenase
MSHDSQMRPQVTPKESARRARVASRTLARLSNECRNEALMVVAEAIEQNRHRILEANEQDCRAAGPAVAAGKMTSAMFERLRVDQHGINEMALRIRDVVRLPDPLGRQIAATELDDGLVLYKESCPLGVIGIVFESRPDVISQVAALALKSGNAVLLKGGAEAAHTNEALFEIWQHTLASFPGIPQGFMHLLYTRSDVLELLSLDREIDLIIPRGSRAFVEFISRNSRIPVLGHGEGICHVYVDRLADIETALRVTFDSKVQYPAACNAAESLLVHESIAREFLPLLVSKLREAGVEVRGCAMTVALLKGAGIVPANEGDWSTEYSDLILSVKIVASAEEAIEHIHRYGSGHTEAIVTKDRNIAKTFMDEINAAGVFHNVSTRFADGFRYGLGAELGVSTNKLHARGPVGLEGLTTYKYKLFGDGHIVAEYVSGTRHFKHKPLTGSGPQ